MKIRVLHWFTMVTGDDIDDMLERAIHQALTDFCERHLSVTVSTPVTLIPIRDMGNPTWSEHRAAACDTARQTYHTGWAFMARYARHMSSLLQEVMMVGAYQCMHLEEYDDQVEAKDCLIAELSVTP
jgi:hypothetical protein